MFVEDAALALNVIGECFSSDTPKYFQHPPERRAGRQSIGLSL
jgi:hypothetical protein